MTEGPRTPLPAWNDSAGRHGFRVFRVRFPDGERFTFVIPDPAKIGGAGFSTGDAFLPESDLRA